MPEGWPRKRKCGFVCDICVPPQKFSRKYRLQEHVRREHPARSRYGRECHKSEWAFGPLPGEMLKNDQGSLCDDCDAGDDFSDREEDQCPIVEEEQEAPTPVPDSMSEDIDFDHGMGSAIPLSLAGTLATWKRKHGVGRAAMEDLLRIIVQKFGSSLPTARSLDRMIVPKVPTMSLEEWTHEGLPEAEFDPACPMFSIWKWCRFILSSRFLRESLVVELTDPRIHSGKESGAETFHSRAFQQALMNQSRSVDYRLFLILYFDEFQPFRFSSMSVGALYFTLGNFPWHLQASVQNRFLLRLFPAEQTRCLWTALRHVINGTQSPRTIMVAGKKVSVGLHLGAFVGDMQARNKLSSVIAPSSEYFCCRCKATRGNLLSISALRTREESLRLAGDPGMGVVHRRQTAGEAVMRREHEGLALDDVLRNPLFEVPPFDPHRDVCVDIMHDEFLGVAVFELESCMKLITPTMRMVFMSRVGTGVVWPRGMPRIRSMKAALSNAGCMRALMIVAPLLFASLVPAENLRSLEMHSKIIRDMMEMTDEDAESETFIHRVEEEISIHTRLLLDLYPHLARKPKVHNRLHYAEHIRLFGPPRVMSSARFEGKHQGFKRRMIRGGHRGIAIRTATRNEALQQTIRPDYSSSYLPPPASEVSANPVRMLSAGDDLFEKTRACQLVQLRPNQSLWEWAAFHHLGLRIQAGDDVTLRIRGLDRIARFHQIVGFSGAQHGQWQYFLWLSYWKKTGCEEKDLGWPFVTIEGQWHCRRSSDGPIFQRHSCRKHQFCTLKIMFPTIVSTQVLYKACRPGKGLCAREMLGWVCPKINSRTFITPENRHHSIQEKREHTKSSFFFPPRRHTTQRLSNVREAVLSCRFRSRSAGKNAVPVTVLDKKGSSFFTLRLILKGQTLRLNELSDHRGFQTVEFAVLPTKSNSN